MLQTRTSRFKVETSWQELVNRRIHKIEIELKEITFTNQAGFLLAKGAFKREITYIEFDGRLRKVDDRVQFEVVIGEALPEPFPLLKSELKQDYYIFQPRQIGDNQAVLEQGFILVVREMVSDIVKERIETILADCIVEQGRHSQLVLLNLPIKLMDVRFKKFDGTIQFEETDSPVINGWIQGTIEYLVAQELKILQVEEQVSWLIDCSKKVSHSRYLTVGSIAEYAWTIKDGCWQLQLKLDYVWRLLQPQLLSCVIPVNGSKEAVTCYTVKTAVFLSDFQIKVPKIYYFPFEGGPTELKIIIINQSSHLIKKGLYLEAALKIEVYYLDDHGVEAYRQWEIHMMELTTDFKQSEGNPDVELGTTLQINEINYECENDQLKLSFLAEYNVKTFERKMLKLIEDNDSPLSLLAEVLVDTKKFTVLKEMSVTLHHKSLRIDKVQSRLELVDVALMKGWVQVKGELELNVVYQNFSGKTYQEIFKRPVTESFVWEEIHKNGQVESNPTIEFDTHYLEESSLTYKYLMGLNVYFFIQRELKPKIVILNPNQRQMRQQVIAGQKLPTVPEGLDMILEQEVPLKLGTPKEIACNNTYISRFKSQNALNAILTEGLFCTDLEYWDTDGFLRQERVEISYWRFIPVETNFHEKFSAEKLFPEIIRTTVVPVNSWPWQKGMVKIRIEITVKMG